MADADEEGREQQRKPAALTTSSQMRAAAADAELRGDWDTVELLNLAADRMVALEAQNIAYRHALSKQIIININGKRHWFRIGKD